MHIQSTNYIANTSSAASDATIASPVSYSTSSTIYSSVMIDIQSMLDKISLMFKSLRDQTQERQIQQRTNSFTLLEAKLVKQKAANAAEAKAGYLSASLSIAGAITGGGFGAAGIKKNVQNTMSAMSMNTLASQLLPKMMEAGGSFADTSIRQNEVNPNKIAGDTIANHKEIYDKDRERTENKADDFARQVLKTQEAINAMFREFTNAAMMK